MMAPGSLNTKLGTLARMSDAPAPSEGCKALRWGFLLATREYRTEKRLAKCRDNCHSSIAMGQSGRGSVDLPSGATWLAVATLQDLKSGRLTGWLVSRIRN